MEKYLEMRLIWAGCFLIVFLCPGVIAKNNCTKRLHELGTFQSEFVYCSTIHSVPVTLCNSCSDTYTEMNSIYDVLQYNCSMFFDKDRINIVRTTQAILTGLWTKAYCDDCIKNNNSVVLSNLSMVLNDCIERANYTKQNICKGCVNAYLNMSDFYVKMDRENKGKICYDMQDVMNRTREMWSKELQCCHRDYNFTLFIVCSCLVASLPLLFYSSAMVLTKRRERNHDLLNSDAQFEVPNERQLPPVLPPVSSRVVTEVSKKPTITTLFESDDDDHDEQLLKKSQHFGVNASS